MKEQMKETDYLELNNKYNPTKLLILFFSLFLVFFLVYFSFQLSPKDTLKISFLNVGQGDSTIFQTPNGGKILIDGGRDQTVLSRLGEELPIFTKDIDILIATHDDSDHITGLIDVLKRYSVKVLVYSLPNSESFLSQELLKQAKLKNTKLVEITKPVIIKSSDGLIIKILFPVKDMNGSESNEASIVTQFIFGNNKFLLTGDLPQTGEIFLIRKYSTNLQSDILKLGHHGSDTSTHPELLQTVRPEVAIVSAGKNNSFGHPHKIVLDLAEKFGIKILRTDQDGTINIYSNGINIWKE